ncbi:DUF4253 domain-containing protein [Streptomyces sporangiiformans]|uniref:DUF4253 domain-containing protein n=1 Tax=Streptomyces sporangiiformans TaxID=2315329 RepID=A0A505DLI4_9ACTN|nr:DUF4253 domain-containing protein [Streptomyces sporangiiformans]TPQ20379.1 DUF4253 domain-containing protein [Streptomyces sporangiiformans]
MATLPNQLPALAADPTGRSLGLRLPPGALLDTTIDGPWPEPLLWRADAPAAPGDWLRLASARRSAGLHPVLVGGVGLSERHPDRWELSPDLMSYPGDHDAEDVLAELWEEWAAGAEDADWPGLAAAGPLDADPDACATEVADSLASGAGWLKESHLALVPARRSADIPAALGWCGPANHENDVARLCAVLRSWEDRFGIRVVALTFDQLVVSVAAPPGTPAEAEAVAAEHFAFCPDNITQGHHTTLRAYAEHEVLGARSWSFWWD